MYPANNVSSLNPRRSYLFSPEGYFISDLFQIKIAFTTLSMAASRIKWCKELPQTAWRNELSVARKSITGLHNAKGLWLGDPFGITKENRELHKPARILVRGLISAMSVNVPAQRKEQQR